MRKRAFVVIASLPLAVAIACGDRTGLLVDEVATCSGPGTFGAGTCDASFDAGRDARHDGNQLVDGLPPIDVPVKPDVNRNDCPDAQSTLVYVITEQYVLYSFYPPNNDFRQVGKIACPSASGATPFSMAVDRKGIARIVFNDGTLYRVSTATAACQATTFQRNQSGFATFGMGYASDTNGPDETLYVAGDSSNGGATGLAAIDATYNLRRIGNFFPQQVNHAELTGTGAGDLFAFYSANNTDPDSFIGQIDKTTARVVGETRMTGVSQGQGWAFAFWGGDFYMFTSPTGQYSEVTRYRPMDGSITVVTSLPQVIVGAGVSTCAPQN